MSTYSPKALWTDLPINGQALSLFRIIFGTVLLYDVAFNILPYWDFLYGENAAFQSREVPSNIIWSLLRHYDTPAIKFASMALYITALFSFLIGYKTRASSFISFLLLAIFIDRNPATASNAEVLEICLLLWCSFMPMDRFWSISSASRGDKPRQTHWPIIPIIALKTQILVVYFCSALFKLDGAEWLNGSAILYTVSDGFYGTHLGQHIFSALPHTIHMALCWGIILLQLCFSALIYVPVKTTTVRAITLIAAALLHIGFIIFMQVHMFAFLSLTYLILLFPEEWITSALAKRRQRLQKIKIFFDPDCGFCKRTAYIFKEFCLSPFTQVAASNTNAQAHELLTKHNSWIVYTSEGDTKMKWEAVSYILKQSPIFWILGFLTDLRPLKGIMSRVYNIIGSNRMTLSRISKPFLKEDPDIYPERTQQYICLFLLSIMLSYTLIALPQITMPTPKIITDIATQTQVAQQWNLFAPTPAHYSYKLKTKAFDINHKEISLTPYQEAHFEESNGYLTFKTHRLLKYYRQMFLPNNPRHRMGYARYLCWKTLESGNPANVMRLKTWIQDNFDKTDFTEYNMIYKCNDIMRPKA